MGTASSRACARSVDVHPLRVTAPVAVANRRLVEARVRARRRRRIALLPRLRRAPSAAPPAHALGVSLTVHPQGETRLWVEPLVAAAGDGGDGQPALAGIVRRAPDFAVLRGQRVDPPDLAHLRDAESILAALLEAGGAAGARRRGAALVDPGGVPGRGPHRCTPGGPAPTSRSAPGGALVETRGLRKFGRPDLRLRRVPEGAEREAVELCWSLVERLARGARPGPGLAAGVSACSRPVTLGHPALEGEWPEPPLPDARSA